MKASRPAPDRSSGEGTPGTQGADGVYLCGDEAATEACGRRVGETMDGHGVVLLRGDLGAGKTVFVRGLAAALGVHGREVQSPTYALMHEHQGDDHLLVHVDLYRLAEDEVDSLALDEHLHGGVLLAIEWPDRWLRLPERHVAVHFEVLEDGRRRLRVVDCR